MANVKKRPDGKWRARYRDAAGKEHARHFARKVDAERWLSTIQADMLRGTYVDPDAGRKTFLSYAEEWRTIQVHRPTTRAQVETHFRRHVYPPLGDRPLGSVRRSEIQAWVHRMATAGDGRKALAPPTVEVIYRYTAAVFRSAVADKLIVSSPCTDIRLPKVEPRHIVPPSTENVSAIREAVPDRYEALITLAAGTGLRQGEALGIELGHVDFLRRQLKVSQQLVLILGEPKIAPPKTEASYRTIPLPRVVVDALAAHVAAFPPADVDLEDTTGGAKSRRRPARLLFTDDARRAIRRTAFSRDVWIPSRRRAKLPDGFTFHDLRHYYASLLIRHGESVKVVQARLGHSTAAETLDTYAHLWPDAEDRTREAVDSVLGDAAPAPSAGSATQSG